MKRIGPWPIVVGALVSLGLFTVEQAHSGQQGGPTTCSLATLKGLYMFAQSGWAVPAPNSSLVPEGVTGYDKFYGNGKFDSLATISLGGDIIPDVAAPGTYSLKSDCTGTLTVIMQPAAPDVHLDIFVAPDGDKYFTIQTDPGNVLSGTIQRVAP
jgi:hypothetical protein